MSTITYRCPNTGKEIATSLEGDRAVLQGLTAARLSLHLFCPFCKTGHEIAAAHFDLDEFADAPLQPQAGTG